MSAEPCLAHRTRRRYWHNHVFVPSGVCTQYLCGRHGCQSGGTHHACAACGWPQDEHATPAHYQQLLAHYQATVARGEPLPLYLS
jgi:hypothetical protein